MPRPGVHSLLFTTDLHGSTIVFRKALQAAIDCDVGALFVGGDLSGKTLTPVVRKAGGKYEALVGGKMESVQTGSALNELEGAITDSGSYPIRVSEDENMVLREDPTARRDVFRSAMKGRLTQWLQEAEELLRPRGVRLIIICGNDDEEELDSIVLGAGFAENPELTGVEYCGREVLGESSANKTPFCCPRDRTEEEIEKRLRTKVAVLQAPERAIFLCHIPPARTIIDNVVALDSNLRQRTAAGSPLLTPAGSTAVRKMIEEYEPLLGLHGHIHESAGFARLGKTLCCNPGSEYSNGICRAILLTFDAAAIRGRILLHR